MKVLRPRYAKIDAVATELLRKYKVKLPPVPIDDIARGEGASITIHQFNNEISGLLLRERGASIIAVERDQPPTRKRFTVAHECGHLMLHEGTEVRVDTSSASISAHRSHLRPRMSKK